MAEFGSFGGFEGFGSFGSSRRRRLSLSPRKGGATPGLTENQALELALLAQAKPKGRSFWDKAFNAVTTPLEAAINVLMRPTWAVASGVEAGIEGRNPAVAAARGLAGRSKVGFGEIFEEHGPAWLKKHDFVRGMAGFTADVLADPLTYLTFGTAPALKGATIGTRTALKAAHEAEIGFSKMSSEQGLEAAQKHAREVINGIKQGPPEQFRWRQALAEHRLDELINYGARPNRDTDLGDELLRAAQAEHRKFTPRGYTVGFQVPFTKGTQIMSQPFGPRVRSAEEISSGLPGLTGVSRALIPGFGNREAHAAAITARHAAEKRADQHWQHLQQKLSDFDDLTPDERLAALHFGESVEGIVRDHQINENVLKKALSPKGHVRRVPGKKKKDPDTFEVTKLKPRQAEYLRAYHEAGDYLRQMDLEYGIKYKTELTAGDKGIVYVPHPYNSHGVALKTLLTDAGFTKARQGKTTIQLLKELADGGELTQLGLKADDLDPTHIMLRRSRRGAMEQIDQTLRDALRMGAGIPTRVPDEERLVNALTRGETLKATAQGLRTISSPQEVKDEIRTYKEKIHMKKVNPTLQKKLKSIKNAKSDAVRQDRMDGLTRWAQEQKQKIEIQTETAFKRQHEKEKKKFFRLAASQRRNKIEISRARRAKVNPQAEGKIPVDDPKMAGPAGEKYVYEPEIAKMVKRVEKFVHDDEMIEQFDRGFGKFVSIWKIGATVVNPGYRMRNTMSDMWNMYLDGVPMRSILTSAVKAASVMRKASKGDPEAVAILDSAYNHGVLSGLFEADIEIVRKAIDNPGGKISTAKKRLKKGNIGGAYVAFARDANRVAENAGRMTHYMYRISQGKSPAEAAAHVRRAHFDYEDLTEFEQRRMKKIAPFYTWTRKNIPFQLQQLVSRPGRFATFPKFVFEMEEAADGAQDDMMPDWMARGMGFKTPMGYVMPPIGAVDLSKINSRDALAQGAMQMLNPVFKWPLEAATGRELATGADIKGTHPRAPVSNLGALFQYVPGANYGRTERRVGDEQVSGPGWNPWFAWAARQVPAANVAFNTRSKIKTAQRGGKHWSLSYAAGVSMYEVDQDAQLLLAELKWKDELKRRVRGMRDEDQMLEPEDTEGAYESMIREQLRGLYGRGR